MGGIGMNPELNRSENEANGRNPRRSELTMPIRGMNCQACVHHIRYALEEVPGVASARVDLKAGEAFIVFDPSLATVSILQEAVEAAGYVADDPLPPADHLAIREEREVVSSRATRSAALRIVTNLVDLALMVRTIRRHLRMG